ncbi:hypothetical protein E5288_WYG019594 [Bos mutus]|uniref:Uncharacterized protein n=1 Tax=Bos mutus TaxID=72004 RepID=A0A6B0RX99_9CETA|nr:hypothetical protein [Bos mutus]
MVLPCSSFTGNPLDHEDQLEQEAWKPVEGLQEKGALETMLFPALPCSDSFDVRKAMERVFNIIRTHQVIQRTQDMVVTDRLPTVLLHCMWAPSRAVSITASLELRLGEWLLNCFSEDTYYRVTFTHSNSLIQRNSSYQ